LVEKLNNAGATLVVVGDAAGPQDYRIPNVHFFSMNDQLSLPFRTATALPTGCYARKNVGYLLAISEGADCIYETDDDNAPEELWALRSLRTTARVMAPRKWANVYRMFCGENIWPRGFPLQLIADETTFHQAGECAVEDKDAPIQQGLVDGSPDVDAIWRMTLGRPFAFPPGQPSVWLPPGTWCPFNSQTTWWWPVAYPLLYLPSHCPFRMTDVFRSFVAQRCLWELGFGIVFHAPRVVQERNGHNLLRDFEDEVVGYLRNPEIIDALEKLFLRRGEDAISENMRACYEELVRMSVFPESELALLDQWLEDVRDLMSARGFTGNLAGSAKGSG
jgi:hypothetical protein